MSLFDRVTKAVGDAVDRGKKEVDQFMRIQKINGQIGEVEKKITDIKNQIQQNKVQIGDTAVEMLRAGTLVSPELQAIVAQIDGFERQIGLEEAEIAEKKAEIEKIKAEDEAQPAASAVAESTPPPVPPIPSDASPAGKVCPQCAVPLTGTSPFCPQCGTKL